jgi:tetratricopeptide (TPR) repeat protein
VKTLFCFLAIVVTLVMAISTTAQSSAKSSTQSSAPWLTESERVKFEELRDAGFDALYNLEYTRARASFSDMERSFPQHPAGLQFLASSLWIETLHKTRRLQSSLFNSKSFYANSDEKVDPKVVDQFRTWTRAAKKLSEARLKQYPQDTEALYFLGSTEGLKASFEEAVERRHFAALRDGSDAVDHHKQIIKLDPTYRDAEITIGLYEYVVGSLPFPAKILAGITGAHGSKKKGIAKIERVALEGRMARDQAKTLLIVLYVREKRYGDAARVARELATKYPRNYIYRLEAADALVQQAEWNRANKVVGNAVAEEEAFAVFESLLTDKAVAESAAGALDLIHFEYGEALLRSGKYQKATEQFMLATKVEGADQGLATMAHLFAGRALDASNQREQALNQYRLVLSRPDVFEAHDEAHKGLRDPFKVSRMD